MKLHELAAQAQTENISNTIRNYMGYSVSFDRLSESRAKQMLGKVRGMLKEYTSSVSRHFSEKNPAYLQLVMMEQALQARIREQAAAAPGATPGAASTPALNDPKAKAVMDKVMRKQSLTPDEQQTMNRIALAKEEQVNEKYQGFEKTVKSIAKGGSARDPEAVAAAIGRKKYGKERFQKAAAAGRKLGESLSLTESEIQTAQVVLAAQDMVDRIQGMMEDISEMQFKDLPALVNSIRNDMGADQATQFQTQATTALTNLLTAVQSGKTEMEAAQGVLTGQAPVVPGQDAGMAPMPPVDGAEPNLGTDLDAALPVDGEEEDEEEVSVGLGRERR
jgi:hypothetical protein